jgi:hypothetical protein
MKEHVSRLSIAAIAACAVCLALLGCNGAPDSSADSSEVVRTPNMPRTAPTKLMGTARDRQQGPIANAPVRIADQQGTVLSTTTDATGSFEVEDIGSLQAPLLLTVGSGADDAAAVFATTPDATSTVVVSPFSTAVAMTALGVSAESLAAEPMVHVVRLTPAAIDEATRSVLRLLEPAVPPITDQARR